jgi:hypothetical protein
MVRKVPETISIKCHKTSFNKWLYGNDTLISHYLLLLKSAYWTKFLIKWFELPASTLQ